MGLTIVFFASRLDFPPVEAFLDTRLFFDIKVGRFATTGTTAERLGHDEPLQKEARNNRMESSESTAQSNSGFRRFCHRTLWLHYDGCPRRRQGRK
jgi:hypothetical protein